MFPKPYEGVKEIPSHRKEVINIMEYRKMFIAPPGVYCAPERDLRYLMLWA